MFYFKLICFILGIMMTLGGLMMIFSWETYKKFSEDMLPEERLPWLVPTCWGMAGLVLITWIVFSRMPTFATFMVSAALSLSLFKAYRILFKYAEFRTFAQSFLAVDPSMMKAFGLSYAAFGLILMALGAAL